MVSDGGGVPEMGVVEVGAGVLEICSGLVQAVTTALWAESGRSQVKAVGARIV